LCGNHDVYEDAEQAGNVQPFALRPQDFRQNIRNLEHRAIVDLPHRTLIAG
jgi:hypothetical protein